MTPMKMYVGGALIDGQRELEVVNPATEESVGRVHTADIGGVEKALSAAQQALSSWGRTSIAERQSWMTKLRDAVIANEDHLRECIHLEMAKPWAATQEDFDSLKNALHYYAEEIARVHDVALADRAGTHAHRMVHEPVGVAVAFIAWNFPLLNLAFKIGPAMAAGAPIVIRPSAATPLSAYAVGKLCSDIGLPAGAVNIVCTSDYAAADALSASTVPALITVIGSTATGRHIMKTGATSIKRYSMELGGNAPALVLEDADLDRAANIVAMLKFNNSGQICVAPNRVYVHASIRKAFEEKVVDRARNTLQGFDRSQPVVIGPLIDGRAFSRIKGLVDSAIGDGAKLLCGGGRPETFNRGHYFAPTVLTDVRDDMEIARQEIFGPVLSILEFENEDELLDRANGEGEGGLSSYIFSRDLDRAERFAAGLNVGEVQINGVKYDIDLPHGGVGQSGIGHDCSSLALYDYLRAKRVTRALR